MRLFAFLLILGSCICLAPSALGQCIDNYEPGCKLPAELGQPQRHCIDPTKYWMCRSLNAKAQLYKCQPNTGFSSDRHACTPWIDWIWTPCVEPPSRPADWEPCYQN